MTSDCTIKFSHFIPTRYIDANNFITFILYVLFCMTLFAKIYTLPTKESPVLHKGEPSLE